jgi:hypothetical protein
VTTTTQKQRNKLAELMDWCYEQRALIHYPFEDKRTTTVVHITSVGLLKAEVLDGRANWDCSQMCYALLGAVFGGVHGQAGATGEMLQDESIFPHYTDPRAAYIGALAVLGPGSGQHVCMVRHRDTLHGNPVVFSHGQESDPRMVNLSIEQADHLPPTTMLSIARLG